MVVASAILLLLFSIVLIDVSVPWFRVKCWLHKKLGSYALWWLLALTLVLPFLVFKLAPHNEDPTNHTDYFKWMMVLLEVSITAIPLLVPVLLRMMLDRNGTNARKKNILFVLLHVFSAAIIFVLLGVVLTAAMAGAA